MKALPKLIYSKTRRKLRKLLKELIDEVRKYHTVIRVGKTFPRNRNQSKISIGYKRNI